MKNGDVIDALPGQREGVLNLHDDQPTAPSPPINIRVWHNSPVPLSLALSILVMFLKANPENRVSV